VFFWKIKDIHSIQKGQMICDKSRKTAAYLPESSGNEAVVSSSSEFDINEKECLNISEIAHTGVVPSFNKTLGLLQESPLSTKNCLM
jgi:hypothetical protein